METTYGGCFFYDDDDDDTHLSIDNIHVKNCTKIRTH
jgi:hypothetical protein